ncbi:MAG TPA: DUF1800 domain-containing protein [Blastocatellia bacterium]|nr:DUF1800 domain-containing protein [Blastocatellia bacterium]
MEKRQKRMVKFVSVLLVFLLALGSPIGLSPIGMAQGAKGQKGKANQAPSKSDAAKKLTEEQKVVHLLERITFGARPGDVERAMKLGWEKYLDEQMRPDRIPDQVIEQRLKNIDSIHLSAAELAKNYPPPQVLQQVLKDRGIVLPGLGASVNQIAGESPLTRKDAKQGFKQLGREAEQKKTDQMDEQTPARPLDNPPASGPQSVVNDPAKRREAYQALREMGYRPQQEVVQEAQQAKILRAVYSERQLQEVMTDFWFNHFNVYIQKGPDRILTASYERDSIRRNVFGKFEDLLKATAEHPAMLFYLDNWMSASPNVKMPSRNELRQMKRERRLGGFGRGNFGDRAKRQMAPGEEQRTLTQNGKVVKRSRGLNENYAREIMELHTLGVDGGYTQKDVQEVARCFTGWTIQNPRAGGEFYFNHMMHDDGEKTVLGKKISSGGGIKDGYTVIHILATHPSTAKFISTKLARKFVSDNPPRAMVDRMSQTFMKTEGDIREVLRTMFAAPEFFAAENYRAKIKTPFEMTVSAVRAIGAETNGNPQFHRWLAQMGEGLFMCQPPTGYPDTADRWVNTGALLERMNFALALSANRLSGTRVNLQNLSADVNIRQPSEIIDHFVKLLLRGEVSPQTRATIDKSLNEQKIAMAGGKVDVAKIVGLILGSPEFQRQ